MHLLNQAHLIVATYQSAAVPETWSELLRADYTIVGKQLSSRRDQPGFFSRLMANWSTLQDERELRHQLIQSVAQAFFLSLEIENQRISAWAHVGRWLVSMPDIGLNTLTVLAKVGSHSNRPLTVLQRLELEQRLSQLAQAHLEYVAFPEEEENRHSDIWSKFAGLAERGSVDTRERSILGSFLRKLRVSSHVHSSDLRVALWSTLKHKDPKATIQRFYRVAKFIDSLGVNCLQETREELEAKNNVLRELQAKVPGVFYHPLGFLPLIESLVEDTNRVIRPPSIETVAPFVNYVELLPWDLKLVDWQQKWLSEEPKTAKELDVFVSLLTAEMRERQEARSPDFSQFYADSIAFSGDNLVAVNPMSWKPFNFFEFEQFAWTFCQSKLMHYEFFMKALDLLSHPTYKEQVSRLKSMMQNRVIVQDAWLVPGQYDGNWYELKRQEIRRYLQNAMENFKLTLVQASEFGSEAIATLNDHALRSTAEEWLELAKRHLDAARKPSEPISSSMREVSLLASSASFIDADMALREATSEQLLEAYRLKVEAESRAGHQEAHSTRS